MDCFPDGWIQRAGQKALFLSSVTLILTGGWHTLKLQKEGEDISRTFKTKIDRMDGKMAKESFLQILSVALPIYATLKIGGFLVAFALSLAMASGVPAKITGKMVNSLQEHLRRRRFSAILLTTVLVLSFLGLNQTWDHRPSSGIMALLLSVFTIRPPVPEPQQSPESVLGTPADGSLSNGSVSAQDKRSGTSRIAGPDNAVLAVLSGAVLAIVAILISLWNGNFTFGIGDLFYTVFISGIVAMSYIFAPASSLQSPEKYGLVVGVGASVLLCAIRPGDSHFMTYLIRICIATMSVFTSRYDDWQLRVSHEHGHSHQGYSKVTELVLSYSEPYTLLYSIVKERDSRRIFYFMWYVHL